MFTLLIPFLTLLAGFSKAEDVPDFEKPVRVNFIIPGLKENFPEAQWKDWTKYDPPDPEHKLGDRVLDDDKVLGFLNFIGPNTEETSRKITWTTDGASAQVNQCKVWVEVDPKQEIIEYDLNAPDPASPVKVVCSLAQQSAPIVTDIPSSTETIASPVESGVSSQVPSSTGYIVAPELKEGLLITFVSDPAKLINDTGPWWQDTTKYEDILDSSWGILDDSDKALFGQDISDTQVKLGQMKFVGLPEGGGLRTYTWEPKPDEGGEPVVKQCTLKLHKDPGVPEVWIWATSRTLEPRRDGKPLDEVGTKKFVEDQILEVSCD